MPAAVYALLVFAIPVLASWPIGRFMARLLGPIPAVVDRGDRILVRLLGPAVLHPQTWRQYATSMVGFNVLMFGLVYLCLVFQGVLPLNPDGKAGLEPTLAFHTAMSFTTNTNLQHYSGEQSLSYASQMLGLTWLQFVSAGTGIACLAAIARTLEGEQGNFARDLTRVVFGLLLPLSLVFAGFLVVSGVPMTLDGAAVVQTLEGATQTIARGPAAAMVAIKQLGTNGGGFFGPNSTHPLENPTFWTSAAQNMAILLIPMASVWMFGRLARNMRHAVVLFGVMTAIFWLLAAPAIVLESAPNPAFSTLPVDPALGNLEGKELRFGTTSGPLWAVSTTATSNGSVSAMHDSLNPLTGLLPMVGMWLNVTFGGVGVGLINLLLYVIVAVFIAGLMVGRTPEYMQRKVEVPEMKLAVIALLLHPFLILGGTAVFAATSWGADTVSNPGSHGFSQILYEMSSAAANNGSGFEGLGDDTGPWNVVTGLMMFFGRYVPIVLPLAIVGHLRAKKPTPSTAGTFRTDTLLFGTMLLGSVFLLGALLFLPAAVLGPVAEHLSAVGGNSP